MIRIEKLALWQRLLAWSSGDEVGLLIQKSVAQFLVSTKLKRKRKKYVEVMVRTWRCIEL